MFFMENKVKSCEYSYLNDDIVVCTETDKIPFNDYPSYAVGGICGMCTSGSAEIEIYSDRQKIVKNDLIVIFPNQLVSIMGQSNDFSMTYFQVSGLFFIDIISGIFRLTIEFFFFMRSHFIYRLTDDESENFNKYCTAICLRASADNNIFRRESVLCWLRVIYWDLFVYFQENKEQNSGKYTYTRHEELSMDFFNLLVLNYNSNRDVAFYADKMCITPKYLTMAIKDVCGKSAKDIIIEYTLLEIKSLLRDSSLEIKDVVNKTNFTSQSLMSRFFRKYAGLSPTEYRLQSGK